MKTTDPEMTAMQLEHHLKQLKLPTMLREYAMVARECAQSNANYDQFLEALCDRELQSRESKAIERRLKQARFPLPKELADFDFTAAPKLNKAKILELAKGDFTSSNTNAIFIGPPGVGKTHLAIALGRELCRRGQRTRFFTASELVNIYTEARDSRTTQRLESSLRRLDVMIIDELGYLPLDQRGAEHLFAFFSLCYEQCSLIVTTNLPFAEWPKTFANDARLTAALIDRLTHRVVIQEMPGDSYRLRSSLKGAKPDHES